MPFAGVHALMSADFVPFCGLCQQAAWNVCMASLPVCMWLCFSGAMLHSGGGLHQCPAGAQATLLLS
jgi:hypothetical protein